MKNLVVFLLMLPLLAAGGGQTVMTGNHRHVFASSPVLVFNMPLNEGGAATTAIDSVSGNNGTWSGTKSCSGSYYVNLPPNVGCFDGSTNYITLTSNTGLNLTTNFSVVAWVYYTGTPTAGAFPRIFSNSTAAVTGGYELLLHDTSGSVSNLLYFQGVNSGSTVAAYANSPIASNTWICVAGTYDGTKGRLYINGTLQSTIYDNFNSNTVGSSSQTPTIGYAVFAPSATKWTGRIADVQVYNTTLTAGQITTACGSAP